MTNPSQPPLLTGTLLRVITKALVLFIIINLVFAAANPLPWLGKLSAYNRIFPGRERLPFGELPDKAYNLSLFNLEAMFAAHEISAAHKTGNEYRVILLGDSSVWGFLLGNENTLSTKLNALGFTTPHDKPVRIYNLGYPTMSLAKDLLILDTAMAYEPDCFIWLVTLESFPRYKQLASPIVANQPEHVRKLITVYELNLDVSDPEFVEPDLLGKTIIGQRRALADLVRLQLYGIMWAATGIDQYFPATYDPPQMDLSSDDSFHNQHGPSLPENELAGEIIAAGIERAGLIPVLIVNEPIFLSTGENSHIRYNFFYPRWAYDQYRDWLAKLSYQKGWNYLDVWDLVPPEEFTNSAIHLSPKGSTLLAEAVGNSLILLLGFTGD